MLRWSSVRDCPRKAVYEATGAPARERSVREERILWRGKTIGRDYADMVAAQLGEDAIERERKVAWPLGTGHIDVFVKETRTVIEVLSTAHAGGAYAHSKLVQAVGYAVYDPEATNVCLVVLNPSDYSEERVIVTEGSAQWVELAAEVERRVAEVLEWRDNGTVPARVCGKPADARGHFCDHGAHCFEGWEPAQIAQITDPDVVDAAGRVFSAKEREREIKSALKLVEEERKTAEAALADHVEAGKVQVGGFQVTRSPRRRESFKLALAREDSRFVPELLAEFTSESEFTVWDVKREGAGDVDYGEEAPF